jgi:sulfate adenylyltransferase subunit 2
MNASQPPEGYSLTAIAEPLVHTGTRIKHLKRLEAEAIGIMREVVAEFRNPVMLYSIGKDSSVMVHLARKAFFPARPPFPLLHIDTGWKFREMIVFRDTTARKLGLNLLVHTNEEGKARGVNPITSGSALHTAVMKTEALKQALDRHAFDAAFGGARRDEERSRAKERVFSVRSAEHGWNPRNQRPELWRLYNTRLGEGESMRVFPLSNWTELDVWEYIAAEEIDVVPLYFAAPRPVVRRSGVWIMVDDERLPLEHSECPEMRLVRFRTLGCYPLTGAIESAAATPSEIVAELRDTSRSERQGRLIDSDEEAAMERKKREGYF